jgi:16S rRNA (uracil1498-N3)-methyltransferase
MTRGRRLFVPPARLAAERLTITAADHRHLARVLRVQAGDTVTLFDGAGNEVEARITHVGRAETELLLGAASPRSTAAAGEPSLVLLTAVPRGQRMDLLVEKTCELGVSRIVPVLTERSVARPDASRRGRWEKLAREAARQCGRADVPDIEAPIALATALAAPDLPRRRLIAWEGAGGNPLRSRPGGGQPTTLLIGPEGGFTAAEVEAARHAGFETVTLGPRILRVETAAMVAVALVRDLQLSPQEVSP